MLEYYIVPQRRSKYKTIWQLQSNKWQRSLHNCRNQAEVIILGKEHAARQNTDVVIYIYDKNGEVSGIIKYCKQEREKQLKNFNGV